MNTPIDYTASSCFHLYVHFPFKKIRIYFNFKWECIDASFTSLSHRYGSPLQGFILSPLRVGLVHCGNWWLGVGAHRYEQNNGALVSARFDSHNTGRVCVSAAGDSADPSRQCPPERKKNGEKNQV